MKGRENMATYCEDGHKTFPKISSTTSRDCGIGIETTVRFEKCTICGAKTFPQVSVVENEKFAKSVESYRNAQRGTFAYALTDPQA